jgi:adenylate cyclase
MDKLFDRFGVKLVGFDVVFAEADESSGLKSLEALASRELKDADGLRAMLRELRPRLDHDARFAMALRNRPVILGYYFSARDGGTSSGAAAEPVFPSGAFSGRATCFTQWVSYGGNLAELQKAAAGAGHFNPLVDLDGTARRVPMLVEYQGRYYESLALAIVRYLLGNSPLAAVYPENLPASSRAAIEWLGLKAAGGGELRVPVDENAATFIPFRGSQGSFPYVSVTDVLNDRVAREQLAGRVVLIGTTAPGLMDLRATPVGAAYPGVEIHANLIAGMLDGTLKQKPPYILGADVVTLLLLGAVMVFLLPRLSPLRATLVGVLLLLVLLGLNLGFWQLSNLVLPLANGTIAIVLLYALNMSWGYFVESRSKRQLAGLFGQYVPPELVAEMSRDPEHYSMAGRKAELTVLFSDVRGFTTISEKLQPDQLATLMNEYLGAMTLIVRKHRGTLDKYIGDAIMAFWGAPVDDPRHARNALLTALEMHAALHELNRNLAARGWPELTIGVGVNTGPMTVGDMGSPVRQSYTVMGDAVNLGSRLEGLTKHYGVGIIIGESTRELLKQEFVFRELDRVRVKGKLDPVSIYEPFGEAGKLAREDLEEFALWNEALRAYRAQDWDQAEVSLVNLQRLRPRYLYELFGKRVEQMCKTAPGVTWDGVTMFETK